MSKYVECPACERQVPSNEINQHLDNKCSQPAITTKPSKGSSKSFTGASSQGSKSTKVAPIFTSALGKRSTNTRPSTSSQLQAPEVTYVVDDDEPEPASKRARQTNTSSKPKASTTWAGIFAGVGSSSNSAAATERLSAVAPLAERLRPRTLDDYVGQEHLTGDDSLLMSIMDSESMGSMILWGPPGCGKTTLARLFATKIQANFKELSATSSGTADVKTIFEEAKRVLKLSGQRTILFMDEIQRFNKAQQDIFLPYVENGWITLIGATTENPSFKVNGALLSRCRVFVLERLSDEEIETILTRAIARSSPSDIGVSIQATRESQTEPSSSQTLVTPSQESQDPERATAAQSVKEFRDVTPAVMKTIVNLATGDARTALSLLELVLSSPKKASDAAVVASLKRSVVSRYDRSGDDRYDMISALHKSLRGSDGSAAMYWLARMLAAGEDPLYISRRLIVVASEDVGLADNHALPLAIATHAAVQTIGMPECRINLAHCVAYFAEARKSTRSYEAYSKAEEAAKADTTLPVPLHLRNAPTTMMKDMKFGEGYLYNPAYAHPVHNDYMPPMLLDEKFLLKEGDTKHKTWDEDKLLHWEWRSNAGRAWTGRSAPAGTQLDQA